MTLSPDQIAELKAQLKAQVEHLPPDKKVQAIAEIESMSPAALESMLEQQKAQSSSQTPDDPSAPKVFRMILEGQIPSVKLDQNSESVAVLSTKAISEGHTIIIPKTAVTTPDKIPKSAFELAESLSQKIITNLKAKSTQAATETAFGESVINLIPIYDTPLTLSSPRTEKSPADLESTKKKIDTISLTKKPPKQIPAIKKQKGRRIKLSRKIP